MTELERISRLLCTADGKNPDESWTEFDRNNAASVTTFGEYDGWEDDVFPTHFRWEEYTHMAQVILDDN